MRNEVEDMVSGDNVCDTVYVISLSTAVLKTTSLS